MSKRRNGCWVVVLTVVVAVVVVVVVVGAVVADEEEEEDGGDDDGGADVDELDRSDCYCLYGRPNDSEFDVNLKRAGMLA